MKVSSGLAGFLFLMLCSSVVCLGEPLQPTSGATLLHFTSPAWKRADLPSFAVVPGSALDLSSRPRYHVERDGALQLGPGGCVTFKSQSGRPVRLIGFNGFGFPKYGELYRLSRDERHRMIDRNLLEMKRLGYDYFRDNSLFDLCLFYRSPRAFEFNPDMVEMFDYLLSSCRKHGIYMIAGLASYQLGHPSWNAIFPLKKSIKNGVLFGYPQWRSCWRTLVSKTLNHVNPYTGLALKDDPMILFFEFYNEQEIHLHQLLHNPDQFPPELLNFINGRYREFLRRRYKTVEALVASWKIPEWQFPIHSFEDVYFYSKVLVKHEIAQRDWGLFYGEAAEECLGFYVKVMKELGVDRLFSQYNFRADLNLGKVRGERLPIVTFNTYWRHPIVGWHMAGSVVEMGSSLSEWGRYYFLSPLSSMTSGLPMFLTEYSHCYWNDHEYEGGAFLPAYCAYQEFSGITAHEGAVIGADTPSLLRNCTIGYSPTKRANQFLAMSLYRRGDVSPARGRVELSFPTSFFEEGRGSGVSLSANQSSLGFLTGFRMDYPERGFRQQDRPADLRIYPEGAARTVSGEWAASFVMDKAEGLGGLKRLEDELRKGKLLSADNRTDVSKGIFESDTGELYLDIQHHRLEITTARTEAMVLRAGDRNRGLKRLQVGAVNVGCCVALTSLDGLELGQSRRMMFMLNTLSVTEGAVMSADRKTMIDAGKPGVPLMQTARLKACVRVGKGEFTLYPLSLTGERRAPLKLTRQGDSLCFQLDTGTLEHGVTPFFELVAE